MKKLIYLFSISLLILSCESSREIDLRVPNDTRSIQVAVLNYMECEECLGDEQAHVVRLGEAAVPYLLATFEKGLSPARETRVKNNLRSSYQKVLPILNSNEVTRLGQDSISYINTNFSNFKARYQVRAGLAINAIFQADSAREITLGARNRVREILAQDPSPNALVQLRPDVIRRLRQVYNR